MVPRAVAGMIGAALAVAASPAVAQSNLDAGKSPAQIFADTCSTCHRSPRELKPSNASFLGEHYTTGGREAAAMAGYLASVGSDPRAVQQRRPPVLGAGQAPASGEHAGANDQAKAPRGRRPSESVESAHANANAGGEPPTAQAAEVPAPAPATDAYEE